MGGFLVFNFRPTSAGKHFTDSDEVLPTVVQLSIILHVLFAKAIFWCWHATTSREVVDGWNRCVKSCRVLSILPCLEVGSGAPQRFSKARHSASRRGPCVGTQSSFGDPMPSESDIRLTREMFRAGQILKIELLDHVILGRPRRVSTHFVSLREQGYFYH